MRISDWSSDVCSSDLIARGVSGRTVDLRRILAGERAATMTRPAAVGVDDDLATGQTAIADRAADHEVAGRVDVELGLLVDPLRRQQIGRASCRERVCQYV